jgi:type II secretion system protein N
MTKQHEIAQKQVWLLLLYGIVAFIVFCIVLFPQEEAVRQVFYLLSQRLNYTFSAQESHILFPYRLELKNVTVARKNSGTEAFPSLKIATIQIAPKFSQLFFKRLAIVFNLQLFRGTLEGVASFDLLHPRYLKELDCLGQGIHLANLKQIYESLNLHINGELSGQAKIKLEENDIQTLAGDYHFEVAPGEIQVMSFPGVNFRQIKGNGSLNQGKVSIQSVRIQGDDLQAQITGDVRLDREIARSYLKARVNLNIGQGLKDKLGPLAGFLPRQNKGGIQLNIRGNLNNLSFMPM